MPVTRKDTALAERLLAHYDRHRRTLPWRALPGEAANPYAVWLSEVMLQQTTVAAVAPRFARFLERWPTLEALAAADEADVMAEWAGLGYYARARNLIACAREVTERHGGVLPGEEAALRKLPGIGDYTAAAIAAIAFGQRAVVVDANVERVVARLFAIDEPLPGAKKAIRAATDSITPDARAGDFAQGLMDLGSSICTVRAPQCLICPLRKDCEAHAAGNPERYPVKAAKKAKPERRGTVYWIERDGKVALVTRPPKGMLGGMRALPDDGWRAGADGDGVPPVEAEWRIARGVVRHGFTHFTVILDLALCCDAPADMLEADWWPVTELADAGLPTLFAKAARAFGEMRDDAA
ncbi:A/G-specific adenine glycosylase [Novosphingopyxis sp. YJ-S2-01]|uniref:A/G-specific adenine glycosylase n=1 Tax=Novosphingopyxis sp. YJ-S2-01 TaxID=2794021 RepID=UPI0018DD29ED|nr:A/G-specific adenine glycosylase [Novosphingopyxis sp. YJ-S2-01]MBH9537096.1 A/G-specific adenine glycosylase [Novosphingopyxis sp. YJ-S2-01]